MPLTGAASVGGGGLERGATFEFPQRRVLEEDRVSQQTADNQPCFSVQEAALQDVMLQKSQGRTQREIRPMGAAPAFQQVFRAPGRITLQLRQKMPAGPKCVMGETLAEIGRLVFGHVELRVNASY